MIIDITKEELSIDWILDNLKYLITEHSATRKRISKLQEYLKGNHDILRRTMSNVYVANNKIVNNFPKYISTVSVGYFMGNPISYQASNETSKEELDKFKKILKKSDAESVDIDLAMDQSVAGCAFEFINVFIDYDNEVLPKSYVLSPERTFVVYDNTIEQNPLFGVYYVDSKTRAGIVSAAKVVIATDTAIYYITLNGQEYIMDTVEPKEHYFGIVPIVEYKNNQIKQGDYEPVLTIIDAYNTLQSDRVNDKEQLIDAILKLKGVDLSDAAIVENVKENRIIVLPENGDAEWLVKQLNEADTDVLRKILEEDIHKFSLTPNITDSQFSGNASGVAMQYKLFGFEQLIKTKERFFQESLRVRIIAYLNLLKKTGYIGDLNVDDVEFIFNRNLPTNNIEIAQMVSQLAKLISKETLLGQVPFVKDVDVEMARLKAEQKEENEILQQSFGFPKVGVNDEEDRETSNTNEGGVGEI